MQPTTVAPIAAGAVLDQDFADNRIAAMRAMGATNVEPPLVRSPYLKNTKTGLILPWSAGLAEQRDIMVNCDAYGNTDPSYWTQTVDATPYNEAEQAALRQQVLREFGGYRQHEMIQPDVVMNAPVVFPEDAKPMDEYFSEANSAIINNLDALLE